MSADSPTGRRFQFSLASLLALMTVAAIGFGLGPQVVLTALMGVIAANMLGAVAALFVTHVIGLPNDGSLPCDTERAHEPE